MKINYNTSFFLFCLFLLFKNNLSAQDSLSVMFYNVENLFDTQDDTTKNDNEFLPQSKKKWTNRKWRMKNTKIAQVITAANYPDVIGLCEVENRLVLEKLINSNLLWKKNYRIIHIESKDKRGIDVALLYKEDKLNLLSFKSNPIHLQGKRATRDILNATFIFNKDTFSFFVNHWPSRYGGKKKSIPKRLKASDQLRFLVDSVKQNFPSHKIISMGDYNDEPTDSSFNHFKSLQIPLAEKKGTIKYKGKWQKFDQFIISNNCQVNATVLRYKFLIEQDKKHGGYKPFRTYYGPRYHGGFSDHLPILLKTQ